MVYTCENCGLKFDTNPELRNHKAKFCLESGYNDLVGLDNRLSALQSHENRGPNDSPEDKKELENYRRRKEIQERELLASIRQIQGDKDQELRATIEKEEIARAIRN